MKPIDVDSSERAKASKVNTNKVSASKITVMIGDSHSVVSFGDRFRDLKLQMLPRDEVFFQFAVSGSTLLDWIRQEQHRYTIRNLSFFSNEAGALPKKSSEGLRFKLYDFLSEQRAQFPNAKIELILELGTNDQFFIEGHPPIEESYFAAVGNFMSTLKEALGGSHLPLQLIWILPPRLPSEMIPAEKQIAYAQRLRASLPRAQWIDSFMFRPDQADQIHFKGEAGRAWGEDAFAKYTRLLQG